MKSAVSIFNDVIGPVMRGPSSSHTAASYRIGKMVRDLLSEPPESVKITFDPNGSYAKIYREQGSDEAFAAGFMQWDITDDRFSDALKFAAREKIQIDFHTAAFSEADHPNSVLIQVKGKSGRSLEAVAKSVGGGNIEIARIDDKKIHLYGKSYSLIVESRKADHFQEIQKLLPEGFKEGEPTYNKENKLWHFTFFGNSGLQKNILSKIKTLPGISDTWTADPLFFPISGETLFSNSEEMVSTAEKNKTSLGTQCLEYEKQLLGLSTEQALQEMHDRFAVMRASIQWGLDDKNIRMTLLEPSASALLKAEKEGNLAVGGIHSQAAAHALAVMHTCNSMGIVCAAPTGGSAGVLPGVLSVLEKEKGVDPKSMALALFAAGGIGTIIAIRATFAAEIAGCQVEIGAAGAMAAAAVVEIAGGSASQAADAAAVSLQNSMGSVCDLVQGICEIPCHTRNAATASSAITCAELVLGGYKNPIPLDETIDAVLAVGKSMPMELRVTALGGLAQTPSALKLKKKR